MTRARENADLPVAMTEADGNVGIGTASGDVTSDGTASRTYVTIQGTANRGRLNLGSTASNGADVGTLGFTNGANTVASISVDSDSGSQTAGKINLATAGSVRMTVDSSGHVTMPNQPAWHLQPANGSSITPASGSVINFGVYGNHGTYAKSVTVNSGRVTVPTTGKYWVGASYRQEDSQTDFQLAIHINGNQRIRSGIWYSSQRYENVHVFGLVALAANDYVEIEIASSNMPPMNGYNDKLTFFSGYLVC